MEVLKMNKNIFVQIALLWVASFFIQSIAVPVQPVSHETNIKTYYDRQKPFPGSYTKKTQEYMDGLISLIEGIDHAIPVVGPISTMSSTASLKIVKKLHNNLEHLTLEGVGEAVDTIRLASLYKLASPLIKMMNDLLLDHLSNIDELLSFWTHADEMGWYHFFHKNPLKWLKWRQVQEVKDKITNLKRLKSLYNFHLGRLIMQVNSYDTSKDVKDQYAWFQEFYTILIAVVPNQKILDAKPNFEALSVLSSRAISSVEKFSSHCDRELKPFALPSKLEQHWMAMSAGIAALCVGGPVVAKHSDKVGASAQSVSDSVKMFGNGMADALWGNDQKWETSLKGKEDAAMKNYESVLLRVLPFFTKDEDQRLDIVKDLVSCKLHDDAYKTKLEAEQKEGNQDLVLIMNEVREKEAFDLNALTALEKLKGKTEKSVLKELYCGMFGGDALPEVKKCIDSLEVTALNNFTRDKIKRAAYGDSNGKDALSINYLTRTFLPLISQTIDQEGVKLADATKEALKTLIDTEMGQGQNVGKILHYLMPKVIGEPKTNKKHKEITQGIQAAMGNFTDSSNIVDTVAGILREVAMGFDVGLVKTERKILNTWKAAKVPMFIVASYLIYKAFKDEVAFGWRMMNHLMPKKAYDELLQALQELTLLLNIYGKKSISQMEPHDVGLMHYLIDKLEQQEETIPQKYRESFMNNVHLLQCSDLSARQKYNIVTDAIFNRYSFLREAHKSA